jgi:predicted nucleic acid-binding protein
MSSSARRAAVDTSLALAALDSNHAHHAEARAAVASRRCALSGHAAFETYSVLTRLPIPLRLGPEEARAALGRMFPLPCWLRGDASGELMDEFARLGIVGGAAFDGLVGAAARENKLLLLTRDRRAERTYRALGVAYEVVADLT